MPNWKPIDARAKKIVTRYDGACYGPRILAYPVDGDIAVVRWWQAEDCDQPGQERFQNFLDDGGNACFPELYAIVKPPRSSLYRE